MKKQTNLFKPLLIWFMLAVPGIGWSGTSNTWFQTSNGMISGSNVYAFAFSPNYTVDQIVFAAASTGVYKSTDSGFNWGSAPVLPKSTSSLSFSPNFAADHLLMAGTNDGVWVTGDGGAHWENITNNLPTKYIQVVAFSTDYAISHTLFAGTYSSGLYKAGWDGISGLPSWTKVGTIPADARVTLLVFSPNFAADQTVFAGAPIATSGRGIYKSTDGGGSWRAIDNWNPQPGSRTVESLAVSPGFKEDGTLLTGLHPGLYKSTDGGESWNLLEGAKNLTLVDLAFAPDFAVSNTVFAAGGIGCYLTRDGGTGWQTFNNGFDGQKSVQALAIPPNQTGRPFNLFAGMSGDMVWQLVYQNSNLFLPLVIR